ncbi:MAG TPA: hypothetical protein VGF53_17630 [Pseudolabrys sp.]|jgi:hypothetical protein
MASRAPSRRWFLRDLPRAYVVVVCAAFIAGGLIYFIDWSLVRHDTSASKMNPPTTEQRYSGSLILPDRGDRCLAAIFDNRTGKLVDKGYVNCGEASNQLAEKNTPAGMDVIRLREVGKVFRHEGK